MVVRPPPSVASARSEVRAADVFRVDGKVRRSRCHRYQSPPISLRRPRAGRCGAVLPRNRRGGDRPRDQATGRRGRFIELDLRRWRASCRQSIKSRHSWAGSTSVNGAGAGAPGLSPFGDREIWDRIFAVNVKGAFFASIAAAKHMRASGGRRIVRSRVACGVTLINPGLRGEQSQCHRTHPLAREFTSSARGSA